jgi:hypothetical protein
VERRHQSVEINPLEIDQDVFYDGDQEIVEA